MLLKLLLGLRNHAHRVDVVKINGESRPVLGTSHPQEEAEETRRAAVLKNWNIAAVSPRKERHATIDQALPQRSQTILSHRLPPKVRQRIDTGMGTLADSRVKNLPGRQEQADLTPPDADD